MAKKASKKFKISPELRFFIFIFAIMVVFLFGLKPIYEFIGKVKTGTLFEKPAIDITPDEPEEPKKDDYRVLEPIGTSYVNCILKKTTENGEMESTITLHYTDQKLRSVVEFNKYFGYTEKYSNYILSEQNKYKEIRDLNIDNLGVGVQINLISANELSVKGVYLLNKTTLENIKTANDDKLNLFGNYDDNVYDVAHLYINEGYSCKW